MFSSHHSRRVTTRIGNPHGSDPTLERLLGAGIAPILMLVLLTLSATVLTAVERELACLEAEEQLRGRSKTALGIAASELLEDARVSR